MREGLTATDAIGVLEQITAHRLHEFWGDEDSYTQAALAGVMGHRQITDAYLAGQARRRNGLLATWDRGLIALHHDVVLDLAAL